MPPSLYLRFLFSPVLKYAAGQIIYVALYYILISCRFLFFFISKGFTMKLPPWLKPGLWCAAGGAAAMVVVGFWAMGWTTAGSAERMAQRPPQPGKYFSESLEGAVHSYDFVSRKAEGQARAKAVTRQLVNAALDYGGTYYLTYQLYPTPEQLHRAYPNARHAFERKRFYDPDELFSNQFYETYGHTQPR